MRILEAKNYEEMSALAAGIIGAQVLLQPRCVLGLATGSSPIGTYEKLVEAHRAGRLDFSQVRTVNLDEYCGLSGDNPQSYRYFMEKHLFSQVNLPQGSTHLPNGTAPDMEADTASGVDKAFDQQKAEDRKSEPSDGTHKLVRRGPGSQKRGVFTHHGKTQNPFFHHSGAEMVDKHSDNGDDL